jgi:hypothetical protein
MTGESIHPGFGGAALRRFSGGKPSGFCFKLSTYAISAFALSKKVLY